MKARSKDLIDRAVAALRKQWQDLAAAAERDRDEHTRTARRNLGKLHKGVRTPEATYYQAILQALEQMAGRGRVADVLERVEAIVNPALSRPSRRRVQ